MSAAKRAEVNAAQAKADAAQFKISSVEENIGELTGKQDQLRSDQDALIAKLEKSKAGIRARALAIYAGSDADKIDLIMRSKDSSSFARRIELIGQAQHNDAKEIETFKDDGQKLQDNLQEIDDLAAAKRKELDELLNEQKALNESLIKVQEGLQSALSGYQIALGGWVFPVQPPVSFGDTFGAPRMTGTKYEHKHEGTDIFAPIGTPLLATTRGVIERKGTAVLGGNKLWLVGGDGTQYYYAHLSAFAEGVENGTVVEAGQVVGYVGKTGNAVGTPAHCHFEIHPNGGPAINPFPTLDAVRRSDYGSFNREAEKLRQQLLTDANSIPVPEASDQSVRAGIGVSREFAIGPTDTSAVTTTVVP